jgi:hypothetical protein
VEQDFTAFREWTRRYAASPTEQSKAVLEAEGVALARARRQAMATLIQSDPQRALEQVVPYRVRVQLPSAVTGLLEERVNATGDYEVMGFVPLPGEETRIAPVLRYAQIKGERHRVFTFGMALDYVTRANAPLNGIRLPQEPDMSEPPANGQPPAKFLMALDPNPARLLDASEVAALENKLPQQPTCPVSGELWTKNNEAVAEEIGGKILTFCGKVHAEDWAAAALVSVALETPSPPANLPTSESSYTEGRKRMLLMRPVFSDYTGGMTTNDALTHFQNFSNYMWQMSYGKLVLAPFRQGSDVTPAMLLPGTSADYDDQGLSKLYPVCVDVARTNYSYDTSQYDFLYVCTASRPAASYAGLAYVGGVGFHLANSYWDAPVAAHEFGHNLGLNHAHFWDTQAKSVIGAGQNAEYGDSNDPLGSGGNPNQYNARYKNYLGWIPSTDVADLDVTGSGTYRLYCFDLDNGVGLRGLKFARSSSQNYWVNFRQRKTTRNALMNGVQLLWTGNGNQGSYLLDVRLKGNGDDNAIVIGRTFSDSGIGFHVTPTGKGNTYPESIDVVVNVGSFPTNQPPMAMVSANVTSATPGQAVRFTVAASDPNGDALAYAWEFGDGEYSINNSPVASHAFATTGEYAVQCTVSDMKGGTARRTVVVTVGDPGTFRISGHVLDKTNRPLAGIRISTDTGTTVFTDSDGSYALAGLTAGTYVLSADEPVAGALSFAHPFFNNPLVVGPSVSGADFIGVTGSLNIYTALATKGSTWRYFDRGADQGTAWRAPGFDDSTWSTGVAPLGYPAGAPIATVIGYGSDANNKYTTTYFRRQFTVADPNAFTNLLLEVLRDDGVIVYLNGAEVFRDNMPAGTVTYSTFATDTVEPDSYLQATLSPGFLVSGVNTLAAEVHQSTLTSSDIALDLALSGLSISNASAFTVVYVNSPPDGTVLTNPTNVIVSATVLSGSAAVESVEFFADGVSLGAAESLPYEVTWTLPAGSPHTLRAIATVGLLQVTSAPVSVTVSAPIAQVPTSPLTLIVTNATWRYLANGSAPPTGWTELGFNDAAWAMGAAQLGYGEGDETTVLPFGGNANSKWITTYFRHAFVVDDPTLITNLSVRLLRDDGGVVYLNGVEVFRSNMPGGPVNYLTLANNADDDGKFIFGGGIDASLLVPGTNVIAVEIHQDSITSSDVSFALGVEAELIMLPRGVYLTTPGNAALFVVPTNITVQAQAVAGGAPGITSVEFFEDGHSIGTDLAAPYAVSLSEILPGSQQIFAVATDSSGGMVTSAPVNITLSAPAIGTALVSRGSVWNYQDNGSWPGTNWTARSFDDRLWNSGPARLGYGDDGEITTLTYGPNPSAKFITTWFRKAFTAPGPEAFDSLLLRLICDDGAVVYLNGAEIYRRNLYPGPVSWNSLATASVEGAAEQTAVEAAIPDAGLVPGTNVIAVEVHQASLTSADLGFDLELTGLRQTNTVQGIYFASPADGVRFNAPATIPLSAFAIAAEPITRVEYFDGAVRIGEVTVPPFTTFWNATRGSHAVTARATYGAGLALTSAPIAISVGEMPVPVSPVFQTLIPARSVWKYWDNLATPPGDWLRPGFDDATWQSAPARFGFGLDGEATALNEGRITHYFRGWFTVTNPALLNQLVFQLARDDGAVVYLNGVEAFRSNMPDGPVAPSMLALSSVNTPDETTYFETVLAAAGSGLLSGSNLVAVELHQASPNSSDAGFDLQLLAHGTTEDRVVLARPARNGLYRIGETIPLEASVWSGRLRVVTNVAFFADGQKLSETSVAPYRAGLPGTNYGRHVLTASAAFDDGTTIDSDAVTVSVSREPLVTTLIPSNSVWKYFDGGTSLGTLWTQTNYPEIGWKSGAARLGYGGDGEVTVVSYGLSTANKYIATYFRRSVVIPPGFVYTNLTFRLLRDDGAVVWLNGHELYRNNMPLAPAPITFSTLASSTVGSADEQTFFTTVLPIAPLPTGTNVVAVEVHQSAASSSDLGFDLELMGSGYIESDSQPRLVARIDDELVELSWPVSASGWILYTAVSTATPPNAWVPFVSTPIVVAGRYVVTIPPALVQQFFRLGRP